MILSVSRRTDVPAFYFDWFLRRLDEGFLAVRNPMRPKQVARISLAPDVLDGIVFWSRQPLRVLESLPRLRDIPFYVQFTLTPYGAELEPCLPALDTRMDTFRRLSDAIGPARILWRYDPILLSPAYPEAFHADAFARMAAQLAGYTGTCVISFIDAYSSTRRHAATLSLLPIPEEAMRRMAGTLARIARDNGMQIQACAEAANLSAEGVARGSCIDAARLSTICGDALRVPKDRGQRPACGCSASIDVGAYNTCLHGCLYCYANYSPARIQTQHAQHDPASPMLTGHIIEGDTVYERPLRSHQIAPRRNR